MSGSISRAETHSLAAWAGAAWCIEAEQAWFRLRDTAVTVGASQVLAVRDDRSQLSRSVTSWMIDSTVAQVRALFRWHPSSAFQTPFASSAYVIVEVTNDQPVDDNLNIVNHVAVEFDFLVQVSALHRQRVRARILVWRCLARTLT